MIILRGDIHINYLVKFESVFRLDVRLRSINLPVIVKFPTRILTLSSTAIDDIFTDALTIKNYIISSLINGLSEHDTKHFMIRDIHMQKKNRHINTIRIINKY